MSARLVVSLSGLSERALEHCQEFADELDRRSVPLSLLIAPRPAGRVEPPNPDSAVLHWTRWRLRNGDTAALHGFDHATDRGRWLSSLTSAKGPTGALRGAEFAALPAHEASLRLVAALAAADQLGLRVDTFVPPRWFASPGTMTALRRHGFAVCADAMAVRDLHGSSVHRSRIHALGPGERAEPWWCRALVLGAGRAARRGRSVRLAVDASDLRRTGPRQALLDAIDLALHHGVRPDTYAAFASPPREPAARTDVAFRWGVANLDPLSS